MNGFNIPVSGDREAGVGGAEDIGPDQEKR